MKRCFIVRADENRTASLELLHVLPSAQIKIGHATVWMRIKICVSFILRPSFLPFGFAPWIARILGETFTGLLTHIGATESVSGAGQLSTVAFTGTADFYPNPPDPVSGCFTYTGFFHWIAANGDKFEGSFEGESCPTHAPGVYDNHESADVDPIASTGRFAGATGHFHLGGQIDFTTVPPSFVLPWEGTISSVASHRRH